MKRSILRSRVKMMRDLNRLFEAIITKVFIPLFVRGGNPGSQSVSLLKNAPVVFLPYHTPACRIQHRALATALERTGLSTLVMTEKVRVSMSGIIQEEFKIPKSGGVECASFSELTESLEKFVGGDPVLARGVIDEFLKKCPVEVFRGPFVIDRDYMEKVAIDVVSARRIAAEASAVVLAETSYVFNRAMVAAARDYGVPAWVLNPDGHWLKVHQTQDENFYPQSVEFLSALIDADPDVLIRAQAYVSKRFSGKSFTDLDSSRAFGGSDALPEHLANRKILCLHAFRDASQLPMEEEVPWRRSLFRSYFEWADFVFSHIAENADEWAIRPHPSAAHYRGDEEILDYLLSRHKLADTVPLATGVSTSALLRRRIPLFTHSGTVALEAAVFGYKAHAASTLYPEELVSVSRTEDELSHALAMPFDEARSLDVNGPLTEVATVLLHRRMNPKFSGFSPSIGQPSRQSASEYETSLIDQQWSLAAQLVSKSGRTALRSLASDIFSEIRPDATRDTPCHSP